MFQQPAQGGEKTPFAEMIGSLVLIIAREYRTGITTAFGEKDAIAADVHVLDGTHGGEVFDNSLIFQGALIGALKPAVGGDPVLGRIGHGTAKPGQSPPFILNPFTDADAAIAGPYWARVQAGQLQQPAAAAPVATTPAAAAAPAAPSPAAPAAPSAPAAAPAVDLGNGMQLAAYMALAPEVKAVVFPSFPATAQQLLRAIPDAVPAGL